MRTSPEILSAYVEYALFIEALKVMEEAEWAANPENFKGDESTEEYYSDFIGEVCMERALGSGSLTPRHDAERIWRSTMKTRALNAFARNAPLHAEACDMLVRAMYI